MPISGYQIYKDTPRVSKIIASQNIREYPNQIIVQITPTSIIEKTTDDSLGKITDQAYQIDKSLQIN